MLGPTLQHVRHGQWLTWMFAVAAAGLLGFAGYVAAWHAPVPIAAQPDPQMGYFMDTVAVASGHPSRYVDHPGTPVKLAGALLMRLVYPFVSPGEASLARVFLAFPDWFFTAIRACLIAMHLLAAAVVARHILPWQGDGLRALTAIALTFAFFALHRDALRLAFHYSHNAAYFALALPLLVVGIRRLSAPVSPGPAGLAVLGLATGVVTAVVLHLLSLAVCFVACLIAAGLLHRRALSAVVADLGVFVCAWLTGFAVAVWPAREALTERLDWWAAVALGQRAMRQVAGQPLWETATANLVTYASATPLWLGLLVSVSLLSVAIARARRTAQGHMLLARCIGLLAGLLFVHAVLLLVFRSLAGRDLLVVAIFVPVLLATALNSLSTRTGVGKFAHCTVLIMATVGFCLSVYRHHEQQHRAVNQFDTSMATWEQVLDDVAAAAQTPRQELQVAVPHFGGPPASRFHSLCAALWWGDAHQVLWQARLDSPGPWQSPLTAPVRKLCRRQRYVFRNRSDGAGFIIADRGWRHARNWLQQADDWQWDIALIDAGHVGSLPNPNGYRITNGLPGTLVLVPRDLGLAD